MLIKSLFPILTVTIKPVDKFLEKFSKRKRHHSRPIFIIGPPRSGTTLVSQLLFNMIDEKSYLSNFENTFVGNSYVANIFSKTSIRDYSSKYGRIKGLGSLSEGGAVFNRWFPHEDREGYNYAGPEEVNDQKANIVKNYLDRVCTAQGSPFFVNKNTKNSVRILALRKIFPNAFFIYVKRQMQENAESLLAARNEINKHPDEWLWVKPRNYKQLINLPKVEQVVGQIAFINEDIKMQLMDVPPENQAIVDYNQLTGGSGHKILEAVGNKLIEWDTSISLSQTPIPPRKKESKVISNIVIKACNKWISSH